MNKKKLLPILFICFVCIAQLSDKVLSDEISSEEPKINFLRPKIDRVEKKAEPLILRKPLPVYKNVDPVLKPNIVNPLNIQPVSIQTKAKKDIFLLPKRYLSKIIQPKSGITLDDYTKTFKSSYERVFILVLTGISGQNFSINSFDSSRGIIIFESHDQKKFVAILAPTQNKHVLVRITPYNGVFDVSSEMVDAVFQDVKNELISVEIPL